MRDAEFVFKLIYPFIAIAVPLVLILYATRYQRGASTLSAPNPGSMYLLWSCAAAMIIGVLMQHPAVKEQIKDIVLRPTKLHKAQQAIGKRMLENRHIAEAVEGKSAAEVVEIMSEAFQNGIERLSHPDLIIWNDFLIQLAQVSPEWCAGWWKGNTGEEARVSAIEELPQQYLNGIMDLYAKAVTLGISTPHVAEREGKSLEDAMKSVVSRMNTEDIVRFSGVIPPRPDLDDDEACWATLTLLRGVRVLDTKDREIVLRHLIRVGARPI